MPRRISTKKRLPESDFKYNSFLVSIIINKVLRKGKKQLARRIVYKTLDVIKEKLKTNPLLLLENAIKNISPTVELKSKQVAGTTYQVPTDVNTFRSINLAATWAVQYAKKRSGKGAVMNLVGELLDASKSLGGAVRKKEETHKMAEANKAFADVKKETDSEFCGEFEETFGKKTRKKFDKRFEKKFTRKFDERLGNAE